MSSHIFAPPANSLRQETFSDPLESTAQIRTRLNIANSTLHWLRKSQGFPAPLRLGQRLVRYESKKVDAWLASRRPVTVKGDSND